MKYALIGCGRVSRNHINAAKGNSLDIAALCDVIPSHASELIQRCSISEDIPVYESYQKMIDEIAPELVAIATDSGLHAEIALYCIEAGCNVIIEKPVALSLSDADLIIEAARKKGVKVSACHQNRFNKSIQKIRKAVEAGQLGKLLSGATTIRWSRGEDYYRQAAWRGTWAMDGGTLMNQCIHNIDLLRWMMGGGVREVVGMTDRLTHNIEAEDFGAALVRFSNGGYGIIDGTTNLYETDLEGTLTLIGEKGTAKAGGTASNILELLKCEDGDLSNDDDTDISASVYGLGHSRLYADVIDAIQSDRQPYVTAKDGRDALELVLAIYKSSKTGLPVKLPLESGSTLDFQRDF